MSKMRFENTSREGFLAKRGFYIALAVCLLAVGAASWTAIHSLTKAPDLSGEAESRHLVSSRQPAEQIDNTVSGIVPAPPASAPAESSRTTERAEENQQQEEAPEETAQANVIARFFVLPITGEVNKRFSETELLYSKTYKDYRIHKGIDIAAAKGDPVKAVGNGRVTDIYDDPVWGTTVVIDHGHSLLAYYCGLHKEVMAEKDQVVEANRVLGAVDTVPGESLDPPHLHFAMKMDGQWVSPLQTMGMMD